MTNIRRFFQKDGIYFLSSVTYQRMPILIENYDLFRQAIDHTKENSSFDLLAWVILPDHCHFLVRQDQESISAIMRKIKLSFSTHYRKRIGVKQGRVWQYRFWDHLVRDQEDLNRHLDYIHYNPVHHDLTKDPFEYKYSSLHSWFEQGLYQRDWGVSKRICFDYDYGE